jgi:hypothetical protein
MMLLPTIRQVRAHLVHVYDGISLCDMRFDRRTEDGFVQRTVDALHLVELYDPRRFRRIQHFTPFIIDRESICPGVFDARLRACWIDLFFYPLAHNEDWYAAQYACTLVHEATHGLIAAQHIPYDRRRWERIERVCEKEAARFLRKARPWLADSLPPFAPARWEPYRHFWWRSKLIARRVASMRNPERWTRWE